MSRLIDADKFKHYVKEHCKDSLADLWCVLIDRQPTAFDTEKVVEQLMVIHDEGYCPNEDGLECVLDKACSDCYREKIIDIVKKGGGE